MKKGKSILLGAVVGIAIGLLLSSIFLVATTLWYVVLTPVIVIFCLVLGLWAGWQRWMPNVTWQVSLILALVAWPICIWGPIETRTLQFYWFASNEMPVYPQAVKMGTIVTPLAADNRPGVQILFWTNANPEQIMDFYFQHFIQHGWKQVHHPFGIDYVVPKDYIGNDYPYCVFEKPGYRICVLMWRPNREGLEVRVDCQIYNLTYRPSNS